MEIIIGQIPEAVYFALFMILVKQLKEKRLLYIALMIVDYLVLKHFIQFSMYFQVAYTFMAFIILKVLYKEKAQITDIFTFTIGSIILILFSFICGTLYIANIFSYMTCTIINRTMMFTFLWVFRNKLCKIQELYKKLWNRNDKIKKKIKSTTFRSINIVAFNSIFYIIHIGMLYAIYYNSK